MKGLIEQQHKVKLYGRHIEHFRKLGIDCKYGEVIQVLSSQLNPGSRVLVTAICGVCQKVVETPIANLTRCKQGFICSHKCQNQRTSKTLQEKFGVVNASQLPSSKRKRIETNKKKFGVENISQNKTVRKKITQTIQERFGVDNISQAEAIKQKKRETTLKHFGVEYPSQSEVVKSKYEKTMRAKYGENVRNASQVSEVMDKKFMTGIRARDYALPSGKVVRIQGYEHFALEYLLKCGIAEEDIYIGNKNIENQIANFFFFDRRIGKPRRYFPDIFIKSQNTVYEVKSTYTINLDRDLIELKRQAIKKANLNFRFLIFDESGKLQS